jgi:hypothetical protein
MVARISAAVNRFSMGRNLTAAMSAYDRTAPMI